MDAMTLLRDARAAGLDVSARGHRLVVRGPRRLAPIAETLLAEKPAVLRALAVEHEVAWRIEAMRQQLPTGGGMPLFVARPGVRFPSGTCGSCGGPLPAGARSRCASCRAAATVVLETSTWTTRGS